MTKSAGAVLGALDRKLRDSARARADHVLADARDDVEERLARARESADALVATARRDGETTADVQAARDRSDARREAVSTVLGARNDVLNALRTRVRDAVIQLRTAPDYDQLVDGLIARARAQLGADAEILVDPDDRGGIVAFVTGRRVDYTLPALAERAFEEVRGRLEDVWR